MKKSSLYLLSTLILSFIALLAEFGVGGALWVKAAWYMDFLIAALLIVEVIVDIRQAPFFRTYLRQNAPALAFLIVFLLLFAYSKLMYPFLAAHRLEGFGRGLIILRNLFVLLKIFTRVKRLSSFFESIATQPAQTILFSFLMVILSGTLLLMLPFTTVNQEGLNFIDALFTATSAVCVTGLIVVDTATAFSLWGQIIILLLIQIGGLGIMAISYFTLFSVRQKVSFQDKLLLSYMLSEENITLLSKRLRTIIYSTFLIEAIGAVLLSLSFHQNGQPWQQTLFLSGFHAVSAFCNAGFSLFSDSLEGFVGDPLVNFTIAGLIIAGGISFAVLSDFFSILRSRLRGLFRSIPGKKRRMSLNTYVVVVATPLMLILSMLLIYGFEHSGTLAELPTGRQYLAAFFQAVTLRTAGFNTLPIGRLSVTTLLLMLPFMFIGAASGSTAGGIKINNFSVILSYLKSVLLNQDAIIIRNNSLSRSVVNKAFLVFFFGVFVISLGTIILSVTEQAALSDILFETVSAFGTVGLSTGLTPLLSGVGRVVIVILMFVGRLGPLTILAAASQPEKSVQVSYPRGDVML